MDTYPREYNKFEVWVVVHNLCDLIYANEKIVLGITLAQVSLIIFYNKFYLFATF